MELYLPIILDGAVGTRLQAAGYNGQIQQEQWMLDNPSIIKDISKSYISAGSHIIYSPTFQSNPIKLTEAGLPDCVERFNRDLAALSRQAVNETADISRAYIAGDISPTGHFLAPLGDITFEELYSCYEAQVLALNDHVDCWAVETMMTLSDARAAILAIRAHSSKPILASFSCDANGRTVSGGDVCALLTVLQGMEIDAYGLNCSYGPDDMLPQLERLSHYAELPLIAKPNAGLPTYRDGATYYDLSPEDFVLNVSKMASYGVGLFGGCCGTTEEHIKALKSSLYGESGATVDVAPPISWEERYPDKLPLASERELFAPSCGFDVNKDSIFIKIDSDAAVDRIINEQFLWRKPLSLAGDDLALLEKALRAYQGRALYVGNLDANELKALVKRYGLVI